MRKIKDIYWTEKNPTSKKCNKIQLEQLKNAETFNKLIKIKSQHN